MAIIALLIAIVMPIFSSVVENSKIKKMRVDLERIKSQAVKYRIKYGYWPSSLEDLKGEFLINVPKNPSGREYQIRIKSGKVFVSSFSDDKSLCYSLFIGPR
jgi:type II secretory pathway pseudopilin PulG